MPSHQTWSQCIIMYYLHIDDCSCVSAFFLFDSTIMWYLLFYHGNFKIVCISCCEFELAKLISLNIDYCSTFTFIYYSYIVNWCMTLIDVYSRGCKLDQSQCYVILTWAHWLCLDICCCTAVTLKLYAFRVVSFWVGKIDYCSTFTFIYYSYIVNWCMTLIDVYSRWC